MSDYEWFSLFCAYLSIGAVLAFAGIFSWILEGQVRGLGSRMLVLSPVWPVALLIVIWMCIATEFRRSDR